MRAAWARPALSGLTCAGVGLWLQRAGLSPLVLAPLALAAFAALALRLDPWLWGEARNGWQEAGRLARGPRQPIAPRPTGSSLPGAAPPAPAGQATRRTR